MNRKAIFDTFRHILGRSFSQAEVALIDRAIDRAEASKATCPRALDTAGVELIKRFEGCAQLRRDGLIQAYPDPATGGAPWTIGWGATGPDIGPGTVWTQEQCDTRLERDLARYAEDVACAIGDAPTSQAQFDALVSFHYNTGAIASATLTRKHRAGDFAGATAEFQRWNKAGGRAMKGLTKRRLAEAQLYSTMR